jgi:hypothetical protein
LLNKNIISLPRKFGLQNATSKNNFTSINSTVTNKTTKNKQLRNGSLAYVLRNLNRILPNKRDATKQRVLVFFLFLKEEMERKNIKITW